MRRDSRHTPSVRQPRHAENNDSFAFRRSRTITGSASTNIQSAGEGRAQLKSPRLHEHSLRKHRRRLGVYLLASLAMCGLLWFVVTSYIGDTTSVSTAHTQPIKNELDTARYQALLTKYLNNHPLERFYFALNDKTLSEFMTSQANELQSVSLTKDHGIGTSELSLTLREPIVTWTINKKQYFVDAEGMAFTVNYFATPAVAVSDKSGISTDAGVVASNKLLRFIGRVITLVNQSTIATVERVELPVNSTREVDFKLSGREYIVKGHLDRDPAGQAADIISAVRYVDNNAIKPSYLDVRVSSKAYYR